MGPLTTFHHRPDAAPHPAAGRSVAQKINGEIVLLAGWGPAILMQFAHPMVAAGVADHSSFRAAPSEKIKRLRHTLRAMLDLTFGTPEQAARAAEGINRVHDRVQGTVAEAAGGFPRGAAYSAHDPELLRWVHCTMLELLPRTYELLVGPLTDEEKDRYCLEASGVAPLLGIPADYLPTSTTQLQAYMRVMLESGEIEVGDTARMLAQALMYPDWPRLAEPLVAASRLATIGLLPPSIRAAYGFHWSPRRERALLLSAGLARRILPRTPARLRRWPAARAA